METNNIKNRKEITPFDNCPALDGYHCQTSSLTKIFHYNKHPLSEDMLFGLGAGMGFIFCGYDGKNSVLASDIDQKANGLKKGFYYPISLEQLSKARSSTYKPFPPKNTYLEFDFKNYHNPKTEDIYSAIKQTIESQLNPPIKNIGIKGMRYTAKELLKWPNIFKDKELRMNLFSLYIFIEIGGTGGGCFRYMYSRFLKECAKITGNKGLSEASEKICESGKLFSKIGLLFKNAENEQNINEKIEIASKEFKRIADVEEKTFNYLSARIR